MALIFLAIYLIVNGIVILAGLNIPIWITGVLALIAGILLLVDRLRVTRTPPSA